MCDMDVLQKLSNRELQAYGALCLHRFCREKQINHPYIDELLEHLLAMLVTRSLATWERQLADLELSGRGDPIPTEVAAIVPNGLRKDFHLLVEFVVEVAVGDIYGRPTRGPLNDLFRCLEILDRNGVERPAVPTVFLQRTRENQNTPYT